MLCMILLAFSPLTTISVNAANKAGRTIILKKSRNQKSDSAVDRRMPSVRICCYVDSENGIQQLDTSEIESYEVWDSTDTAPIIVCEDERQFVDYILNDPPECIVKLYSPDYIYIGYID